MLNLEFIIEAAVIAFILILYTSVRNYRLRKHIRDKFDKECYNSMSFVYRKPIIAALLNFSIFFLIALIIKILYFYIFS